MHARSIWSILGDYKRHPAIIYRAGKEPLSRFEGLIQKNGSSQGQNLALTFLIVPNVTGIATFIHIERTQYKLLDTPTLICGECRTYEPNHHLGETGRCGERRREGCRFKLDTFQTQGRVSCAWWVIQPSSLNAYIQNVPTWTRPY